MEREFWLERWDRRQIGFHKHEVHEALRAHWPTLGVPRGARVLVPLCGKSRDMLWLRDAGHPVLGVELSRVAVEEFFAENGMRPEVTRTGPFERWHAEGITILCGDFFDLPPDELAACGGAYDRAALVALPPDLRRRYAQTLKGLPAGAPMLLITLAYPPGGTEGPPFAVGEEEVRALYGDAADVVLLARTDALAAEPAMRARGLTALDELVFSVRRTATA